jgi:hypothetical protein
VIGPDEGIGFLAYGAGNQFVASVSFAVELPRPVERILYYGDVDLDGLEIPARTAAVASEAGLPPVEPAAGLYRALLSLGRRGRAPRPVTATEARDATGWLPADLRDPVRQLLESGERLAQEGLGLKHLRDATLRREAIALPEQCETVGNVMADPAT